MTIIYSTLPKAENAWHFSAVHCTALDYLRTLYYFYVSHFLFFYLLCCFYGTVSNVCWFIVCTLPGPQESFITHNSHKMNTFTKNTNFIQKK